MTNFGIRSSSEPPENNEYDKNTGLKVSAFPIKINGSSLRSQDHLDRAGTAAADGVADKTASAETVVF